MNCLRFHPEIYHRDCQHCLKFQYAEEGPDAGKVVEHEGVPVPRPVFRPAPCRDPKRGCPKGTPENPHVLSPRNQKALLFYKRCRLTGRWPDDEIAIRNGIIIQDIEQAHERHSQAEALTQAALGAAMMLTRPQL